MTKYRVFSFGPDGLYFTTTAAGSALEAMENTKTWLESIGPELIAFAPLYMSDLIEIGINEEAADVLTDMGQPTLHVGTDGKIYVDGDTENGQDISEFVAAVNEELPDED